MKTNISRQTSKTEYVIENSPTYQKRNQHFRGCTRDNRPYVYISPGRKSAWVELDMITTNRNLDAATINRIWKAMVALLGQESGIGCSSLICRATKVPNDLAETLAARIYKIACDAMPMLQPIGGNC